MSSAKQLAQQLMLIFLALLGTTSCTYDNPLLVWSDTNTTTIFFGTFTDNNGDEFSGPGFVYGPINISWKGDKPLRLVNLTINFPNSGKLSADYTCTADGDDLIDLFPDATDLIVQPNQTVNGLRLVCSGLASVSDSDTFIVTGTTKIRGTTGSATDQKIYRSDTKLSLYWFPEEEP